MKDNIKISVIIPCYNGEKYLAQCLENLLFQSYKHLEIIVINDGSTDKTEEIAQKYPVKIISQKNQGPYVARNIGIEKATGKYIHFLDVDDFINADFYQKMISAIEFADAEIACCGIIQEQHALKTTFDEQIIAITAEDKLNLCRVWFQGYLVKYLFKKSFLIDNNLKFYTGRFVADMPFSLQAVFLAKKVVTVPNAIYIYKHRQNSILTNPSKEHSKKRRTDYKFARQFCLDFAQTNGLIPMFEGKTIWTQYKLFGIPFMKKRVSETGRIRWYLFGLYVFQKKYI